jgi:hypothetical protein
LIEDGPEVLFGGRFLGWLFGRAGFARRGSDGSDGFRRYHALHPFAQFAFPLYGGFPLLADPGEFNQTV